MTSQAGSIDGIGFASSQNVYDTLGYGVVTQTLYYDQSGTEVADRRLYFDLSPTNDYGVGPKTTNSDGSFGFDIIQPGGSGVPNPYVHDTFSSAGIMTRADNYTPIYITSPDGTYEGSPGYTDSYTLFDATSPGSSGMIGGH